MNWFKKKNKEVSRQIKDFPLILSCWPAGNSFDKTDEEKSCPLFPYWDKNGKYIRHEIGEFVPLFKVGDHTAIYKIIDWKINGNDHAGFDDGRWYNFEFVELCRYKPLERIKELSPTPISNE